MMQYETPLWTLIGVTLGFLLSFLTIIILNRRSYKKQLDTVKAKIISYIRDNNVVVAKQAISELEASFKEPDQIIILESASFESSLNASNNEITEYILEKLEWMMISYNVFLGGTWDLKELELEKKKDKVKINSIHSIIWEILRNVVELHQSKSIINKSYDIIETLDKFSLKIKHYDLVFASIQLYRDIGVKSVGIEYPEGFKHFNFKFGIDLSIDYLRKMIRFTPVYCKDVNVRKNLLRCIEKSIKSIKGMESAKAKKT